VLVRGLGARYVLVGDDFRFGARRAGTYAMLDEAGTQAGFDVARMLSYEVHGLRVSSSAVREALAEGRMLDAPRCWAGPTPSAATPCTAASWGASWAFRTLNLRFAHPRPAAMGIFVVRVHGLGESPVPGVASLGVRPTVEDAGRVLLEVHCLHWPRALGDEGGYGRVLRVELLHKLHDERHYESLDALRAGIARDTDHARAWWRAHT
jgi:riboflavin kinase/FMN adenylyltransferase